MVGQRGRDIDVAAGRNLDPSVRVIFEDEGDLAAVYDEATPHTVGNTVGRE